MFSGSYFAQTYFAPTYFPGTGTGEIVDTGQVLPTLVLHVVYGRMGAR